MIRAAPTSWSLFFLPLLVTLLLHIALLVAVFTHWQDSQRPLQAVQPSFISATLLTLEPPKPISQPAQPETRAVDAAAAAAEKRQQEAAAAERLRVEQERIKAQQQAQEQQRLKEEQERAARERAAEQRQREQQLEQQRLAAEQAAQQQAQQQAESDARLTNSYIGLISARIQRYWNRPPSARNNMVVVLSIRLLPSGELVSVNVVNSSGNAAFDRSAEEAVRRAAPFAELQQLPSRVFENNFRQLQLRFRPEDLRL